MDIFAAFGAIVREAARLEQPRSRPEPVPVGVAAAAPVPDAPPPRRHWPRPEPGRVPLEFMSPVVRP